MAMELSGDKAPLIVKGTNDPLITIDHSGSAGNAALWFKENGAEQAYIWWEHSKQTLHLGTQAKGPVLSLPSYGAVGIGTRNPRADLDVTGSAEITQPAPPTGGSQGKQTPALHVRTWDDMVLCLESTRGGGGNRARLDFSTYGTTLLIHPTASLVAIDDGAFSSALAFETKKPGAEANDSIERLRITSSGNVGIATADPQARLDVAGDARVAGALRVGGEVRVSAGLVVGGDTRMTGALMVGAGGDKTLTVRHVRGKHFQNDSSDDLYLNWETGKGVFVGGAGAPAPLHVYGDLVMHGTGVTTVNRLLACSTRGKATVDLNGEYGLMILNHPDTGAASVVLDGTTGDVRLEGGGLTVGAQMGKTGITNNRLLAYSTSGTATVDLNGEYGLMILNHPDTGAASVVLDGTTGDIRLEGGDCAENFEVPADVRAEPGMVMVFDDAGALRPAKQMYDRRVAGVISGAGDLKPGLRLGGHLDPATHMPLALAGKVYCKVDAGYGAIEAGDLLTTSPTSGHAMRTSDPARAFGAVIGKALQPLSDGVGLIPVLVALQ